MQLHDLNDSLSLIISQTQANFSTLMVIIAIPWGFYIANLLLNNNLLYLGIIPRRLYGLLGILFAPVLHANFNHLFFNSLPLLVLSNFILINGLEYYLVVTLLITLFSGFLIWCFAKPGIHIGASSVITGYWGLLVTSLVNEATLTPVILALLSLYYFAGIFLGIFPGKKGVSWEGHLFGLIAGVSTSYLLSSGLVASL